MRHLPLALAVLATVAAPVAAHADTYDFTISTSQSSLMSPATSFVATGTLTGDPISSQPPTINLTGVTGAAQNYTFTGVVPLGAATGFTYDNLVFTDANARHVDGNGVLLYLTYGSYATGSTLAHVYDSSTGYHVDIFDLAEPVDVTPFAIDRFDLNPSTVPEPSTLALLGTGALGLCGAIRRRWLR